MKILEQIIKNDENHAPPTVYSRPFETANVFP